MGLEFLYFVFQFSQILLLSAVSKKTQFFLWEPYFKVSSSQSKLQIIFAKQLLIHGIRISLFHIPIQSNLATGRSI